MDFFDVVSSAERWAYLNNTDKKNTNKFHGKPVCYSRKLLTFSITC